MPSTLGQVLARALVAHGAREVFGLPGDFALPLFQAFHDAGCLPMHQLLHEPGVGFAADAAARMHGSLGVALVTYGAGALNMVNPIANAYAEHSPVVVVSGAPGIVERRRNLRLHHQVKSLESQRRIFAEVTCDSAILESAERAPEEIARVLRSAREHSRPVYLEVPRDLVNTPAAEVTPLPPSPWDPEAVEACAEDILERLRAAKRPAMLVDVEVRRYGLEARVAELAERLGVPVATTLLGSGLMADHPGLVRGIYFGAAGDDEVTVLIEDADALLALGVIPTDVNLGVALNFDWRRVIDASERSVRVGHRRYDDLPLAALIEALLAQVPAAAAPRPAPAATRRDLPPPRDAADLTPADIALAIDRVRRKTPFPIAVDVGDCLFTAVDLEPGLLVASAYYTTMGMAIPAALGIQAATGQRALALVGDGAFHMTANELAQATHPGWDPIILVMNNAEWTMLRSFQGKGVKLGLPDLDLAQYARALGGEGQRATTPAELEAALAAAIERRGRFQLIDARLPPGRISGRLQRFGEAFTRARN